MSSEKSKEPLTYDEVTSWRSDAVKLYCRQRGLKVSGSKQELVARVFDFTPDIIIFPLHDEHLLYPCDCLTFSDWSSKQKWLTNPTCRSKECACAPFLQTKQPCSPSKSLRWFGKLNKGSCIIDFLHGSINKISYLETHSFNLFPLFG